jgi:hypothetical protein
MKKLFNEFKARFSFGIFITLILSTVVVLAIADNAREVTKSNSNPSSPNRLQLASTSYTESSGKIKMSLTLWRQNVDMASLSPAEQIRRLEKALKNKETDAGNSKGNLAFVLVASPNQDLEKGRVCWISYDTQSTSWDGTVWAASIASDESGKRFYLILVKSNINHVTLNLYEIDPSKNLGTSPLELDPRKMDQWPNAATSKSTISRVLKDDFLSGIQSITVQVKDKEISIHADRFHKAHPAVDFFYNTETAQWTSKSPPSTKIVLAE